MDWVYPVLGYVLGSILPADYIVRRRTGRSPREFGENNGAAATWRLVGPKWGVLVGALDIFKGFLPVYLALYVDGVSQPAVIATAVAPVLGHNWPIHRGFQGGRGLAACVGASLCLAPVPFLIGLPIGIAVAVKKRRTPWVGVVGLPIGILVSLWQGVESFRVMGAALALLALAVRQIQWYDVRAFIDEWTGRFNGP